MQQNPLLKLREFGQSIWLDLLSREILSTGKLQQLIDEDGLCGVTSNPKIFQEAIGKSSDYDDAIRILVQAGKNVEDIYQALTVEDIQWAADLFRSIYHQTDGRDGFVSLEVSPELAYETEGTLEEARRLWRAVDRPNLFIKVPATFEGLPAIQQLIREGINVNVTLLFSLQRYQQVAQAYINGLVERMEAKLPLERVASVASFFLSRVDVLVDSRLEKIIEQGGPQAALAGQLRGQAAIASAKVAYQIHKDIFATEQFRRLEKKGARPQRLLWASTSTKNPDYSDVKYVEALIGPGTINTMPLETLEAYRDHGQPALRLEEDVMIARQTLARLADLGIDLTEVTQQLEQEGVKKLADPHNQLMGELAKKFERYRVTEMVGKPS
jgi:transaldolase